MYTGVIEGVGPRYCPSVEDKVMRFAGRTSHQIFVEPEGLDTPELYPNGISTSLPFDAQIRMVQSIRGFERAHITRPGYAIEYDYFDPRDLHYSLETRNIPGLFFAGQINGTTGYEEAAAQGLLAGLNAARKAGGLDPWWPRRDEAYLGVLVDDLVNLGANEPYRMFTSRAEFRLRLREDNADTRLTERGRELGLVGERRWNAFERKREHARALRHYLGSVRLRAGEPATQRFEAQFGRPLGRDATLTEVLRRPEVELDPLLGVAGAPDELRGAREALLEVETDVKYEGYIRRQDEEIARIRRHEGLALACDLDYRVIEGLSSELRQKLCETRPATLARAARIPGMTPAALSVLLIHSRKHAASA
jgi:tRNA uridine 5-carboxymethylaminomethyl modification enzyme